MKIQNTFKANVIWGSLGFSLAIIAALLFDTQQTISYLAAAKAFIFSQFTTSFSAESAEFSAALLISLICSSTVVPAAAAFSSSSERIF